MPYNKKLRLTKNVLTFFVNLANSYAENKIGSLAAALAYYMLFSLAPILWIAMAVAGRFFGQADVRLQVLSQVNDLVGSSAAYQIQVMIDSTAHRTFSDSFLTNVIGPIILFFAASGLFSEIQYGLNTIWGVQVKRGRSLLDILKERLLSFTMVLGICVLLLTSLTITGLLNILSVSLSDVFGPNFFVTLFINESSFFLIGTLLFGLVFKILPDTVIRWRDVWFGAFVTAIMFSVGKIILGYYLNKFHIGTAFGAAGSLIFLLVWFYYMAQIFFIGAEITKLFATRHKNRVIPKQKAELIH